MKKSFLLYSLILSVLFNVYTYVYLSKQLKFEKEKNKVATTKHNAKVQKLQQEIDESNYFSLAKNENAQNYFEATNPDKTILIEKLIPVVTEKLLDFNSNPKGNPFTGQDRIGANKFVINKVRILNHRWIIADFSDGEYWGEVLLKYFINADETISFEVHQSLLYNK